MIARPFGVKRTAQAAAARPVILDTPIDGDDAFLVECVKILVRARLDNANVAAQNAVAATYAFAAAGMRVSAWYREKDDMQARKWVEDLPIGALEIAEAAVSPSGAVQAEALQECVDRSVTGSANGEIHEFWITIPVVPYRFGTPHSARGDFGLSPADIGRIELRLPDDGVNGWGDADITMDAGGADVLAWYCGTPVDYRPMGLRQQFLAEVAGDANESQDMLGGDTDCESDGARSKVAGLYLYSRDSAADPVGELEQVKVTIGGTVIADFKTDDLNDSFRVPILNTYPRNPDGVGPNLYNPTVFAILHAPSLGQSVAELPAGKINIQNDGRLGTVANARFLRHVIIPETPDRLRNRLPASAKPEVAAAQVQRMVRNPTAFLPDAVRPFIGARYMGAVSKRGC